MNEFFQSTKKYMPLVKELVSRDLKVKYRRSALGYLWSLLNPLLMMTVMTLVFSYMFRFDIPNYPLYLICGQTMWNFFSEGTNMAMQSIWQNASLLKKVYVPKYVFPLSRIVSSFVNMLFSLTAILIVMLATRAKLGLTILLIPIPMLFLFMFSFGVGMVLAALSVYFRDISHLYSVVTLAWMYATPIFYPLQSIPERIQIVIRLNPMYQIIDIFRNLVIYESIPAMNSIMVCALISFLTVAVGLLVFGKLQKRFILYI